MMRAAAMRKAADSKPNPFFFRRIHPHILIGTASDRYAGWIGQVYSAGELEATPP
jgi:hypothetical protein